MNKEYKCYKCKEYFDASDTYEYRGIYSCSTHFDEVIKDRDFQRIELIYEEDAKTKVFKGLDLSESAVGKGNRELLKPNIEIAGKESAKLKEYERPDNE